MNIQRKLNDEKEKNKKEKEREKNGNKLIIKTKIKNNYKHM